MREGEKKKTKAPACSQRSDVIALCLPRRCPYANPQRINMEGSLGPLKPCQRPTQPNGRGY